MDRRRMLLTTSVVLASPALAVRVAAETSSDYLTKTLTIGTLSKKMSQLASEKATNARIKEFAGFEIAEQTAVAQVLTDKLEPPPLFLPRNRRSSTSCRRRRA